MDNRVAMHKEKLPSNSQEAGTPKKRGERLKRIRNLANLTRTQMCSEGDISVHTLSGWEIGRFGGLTYAGAVRVIKRVAQEGVHCSIEWLLNEIGVGPTVASDYKAALAAQETDHDESNNTDEEKLIVNELLLFKQQNKNSIDFIVEDDAMTPHYSIGDYVAGKRRYKNKIETIIGLVCIVQTAEGKTLLRTVMKGEKDNTYHLICSNSLTKIKEPIIYNTTLVSAAPITWHRKKEPT